MSSSPQLARTPVFEGIPGAEEKTTYKYINTFDPLPWQVEPWSDFSKVLLLTGSAGGGKSRIAAEKIHAFCLRYPNATALILRKVRATMSNSTLLFLKREIIGRDPRVVHRPSDHRFEYDNGSIIAYGGMKDDEQREHIRSIGQSGGLDIVWMEEATQFNEEDFNEVIARMRGRAAPWRQIILSTNPDAPGHWINVRLILGGEASVIRSQASDNTYNPDDYITDTLNQLSGVQYRRLVLGEWAVGSGKVIDTWSDDYNKSTGHNDGGNVSEEAVYLPDGGPVYWCIDDGYSGKMDKRTKMFTGTSHPRAIMMAQMRANGRLVVFHESLAIEKLAEQQLLEELERCRMNGWPTKPKFCVRDRAAAQIDGVLGKYGIKTRFNTVLVDESIKELRTWIGEDKNGFRRLLVHPRLFYTRYQMQTYSEDKGKIIKAHDDTIDALRYLVWELEHGRPSTVDIATIYSVAEVV